MDYEIKFLTEDDVKNNVENNKKFLAEAEKEFKRIKKTKGYITDGDIAKVLGIQLKKY